MPIGNPAQILIGNRNRMPQRIQQYRVRRLLSHARQCQQPLAQPFGLGSLHSLKRTAKLRRRPWPQTPSAPGPCAYKSPRAEWLPSTHQAIALRNPSSGKSSRRTQIIERPFNRLPRSVLRKVGAQNHFKRRLRRPPVLRSICQRKLVVHAPNPLGRRKPFPRFQDCAPFAAGGSTGSDSFSSPGGDCS